MPQLIRLMAALPLWLSVAGVAAAQNGAPWDGFYAGLDIGGANPGACGHSALTGPAIDPAGAASFANCPGGGIVGGLNFGENFQRKRLVWGVGADLDFWNAKNPRASLTFAGAAPPPGTYGFTGRFSPKEFAIIGGRIGYAGDVFLPYVRAGGVVTTGAKDTTLYYVPTGAIKSVASFDGGKNFASTGWAAGAGVEVGLNGAWSLSAEYLHMSLGKGSNSNAACAGAAASCAPFDGITLDSTHSTFTANMFRIGITYWIDYWSKP